jgi:hypothetical protein
MIVSTEARVVSPDNRCASAKPEAGETVKILRRASTPQNLQTTGQNGTSDHHETLFYL